MVSPDRESRERDYVKKRREYLRLGVLEYVIIDRMRRRVTVYTHESGRYRKTRSSSWAALPQPAPARA